MSLRVVSGAMSRLRNIWYRLLGVRISGYVWMKSISIPRNFSAITLHAGASLDDGVVLLANGDAGAEQIVIHSAYINRYTMIDAHQKIEICSGCMIGPHCYITDSDHSTAERTGVGSQLMLSKPVTIEDNAWIGAGVIILKGVTIGTGAVVGAGAVVSKSVAPWTVVAGIPAKTIRGRE
ncbi:acyltransferase [Rubripirellula reticaptiva]|nr:acyltransferase [Rubripirellula reticaptiva]